MRKILIITEDSKVADWVQETLKEGYECACVSSLEEGVKSLKEKIPDMVVLDFDLKAMTGLEALRQIKRIDSRIKVIMISASADIGAAVTAAKMGASDFILKPLEPNRFRTSVEKFLVPAEEVFSLAVFSVEEAEWLTGESGKIKEFLKEIEKAVREDLDILLIAEKGIDKKPIAEIIHKNGVKKIRKLMSLDMLSFEMAAESHFWVALQELLSETIGASQREENLCGTLYLENFDALGALAPHFQVSLLEFLKARRGEAYKGRVDREIKVIMSIDDEEKLFEFENQNLLSTFSKLKIPPLRERKEDLPVLASLYLNKFSEKFGRPIKFISTEVLNLLMIYDWPGNIEELKSRLQTAALRACGPSLTLTDLPLEAEVVLKTALKRILAGDSLALEKAKESFEKELFSIILEKTAWDEEKAARILDLPKTYLTSRIQTLGLKRSRI